MYQIVEIMRFCKVGEKTEFNSHRVYLIRLKVKFHFELKRQAKNWQGGVIIDFSHISKDVVENI